MSYSWDFGDGHTSEGSLETEHLYPDNGTYVVTLTATDSGGLSGLDTLLVTVTNAAPLVDPGTDLSSVEGSPVVFSGTFDDPGANDSHAVQWFFGDGLSAATLAPTHVYKEDGTFTATLQVTDNDGAMAAASIQVDVSNAPPVPDAGGERSGAQGEVIVFSGSVYDPGALDTHTYLWDFGDGQTAEGTLAPEHSYLGTGVYTVKLTVTDDDGGTGTDETIATVSNGLPLVDAGPDQTGAEGDIFSFQGTSTDPGGDELSYKWHFGDGSTLEGTLTTEHVFGDNGTYMVTLTTTDEGGLSASDTLAVTVKNVPPSVDPGPELSGLEGSPVVLSGTFTDPGVDDDHSFLWVFGDGNTAATLEAEHVYMEDGQYSPTLQVTDKDGATGTTEGLVVVDNAAPTVNAGGNKTAIQGTPVQFNGSFNDPGLLDTHTFVWDFGDGETAVGSPVAVHTYVQGGSYVAVLTVTDDDDGIGSDSATIEVGNAPPLVDAGPDQNAIEGDMVNFSGTASDPGGDEMSYYWEFGDGNAAEGLASTQHTYEDNGLFTVTLTATDESGASASDYLKVNVKNVAPVAIAGPSQVAGEGDTVQFAGGFEDAGAGDSHTFLWDFGDGATASDNLVPEHAFADDGEFLICLTVTDDDGGQDEDCLSAVVKNTPPVFTSQPVGTAIQDQPYAFQATAEDPAGEHDPIHFALDAFPQGMSIAPLSGLISWTPLNQHVCVPHEVTIRANDDDGGVAYQKFELLVENVNDQPVILSKPPMSATQGFQYTYFVSVEDPDVSAACTGEVLWFALETAPEEMAVDQSGTVQWTPTNLEVGTHPIVLTVTDAAGESGVQEFLLTVTPDPQAPVAIAGPSKTVDPGLITLDGSNSYPGAVLESFEWTSLDGPVDVDTAGCIEATCTVRMVASGTYLMQLVVTDQAGHVSPPGTVEITVANLPPTAWAGYAQVVEVGETVLLDGLRSGDINGDELEYLWTFINQAQGEAPDLSDPASSTPSFVPQSVGQYQLNLTVSDGEFDSVPSTVLVTAVDSDAPSFPPVVVLFPESQVLEEGGQTMLDGQGSYDPDDQELTYVWSQASGPVNLVMAEPTSPVQVLELSVPGVYVFSLVVNDGTADSRPGEATVEVLPVGGMLPSSDAGPDDVLYIDHSTWLDGTASADPNGGPLTFAWKQLSGLTMLLDDPTSATPMLEGIWPGTAKFQLTAKDEDGTAGKPAGVYVFVVPEGKTPPIAEAGTDQILHAPTSVTISGASTHDEDGDPLTWVWVQTHGPSVPLDTPTKLKPVFVPPSWGRYVFDLIVWDGEVVSRPDSVSILISTEDNKAPVADAGDDLLASLGSEVTLDGGASIDPEGELLTYQWHQADGPVVELWGADTATPSFVPVQVGSHQFQLIVSDSFFPSSPDNVTVFVEAVPPEPDVVEAVEVEQHVEFVEFVEEVWNGTEDVIEGRDGADLVQSEPSIFIGSSPDSGCGCSLDGKRRDVPPSVLISIFMLTCIYAWLRRRSRSSSSGPTSVLFTSEGSCKERALKR